MSAAPASPDTRAMRVRRRIPPISLLGIVAFACGLGEVHKINVVGEVYLAEIGLPLAGLLALGATGPLFRNRAFLLLLGGLLLSFAGYVLSDVIRDTPEVQYLKGWGRLGILAADFVCLALIAIRDRNALWWFAFGLGLGGVAYLRLVEHLPLAIWKFGYSEPATVLCAALAVLVPQRVAAAGFVVLAVMSMKFDFRMHSGVCLFMAGVLWVRAGARPGVRRALAQYGKLGLAAALGGLTLLYLLKSTESEWHEQRRGTSSFYREAGIRTGIGVILRSPLVGYGSWGVHADVLEAARETGAAMPESARFDYKPSPSTSAIHSQMIQAWAEGGVLGAAFFIVFGLLLAVGLPWHTLTRPLDLLTPVVLYFHVIGLWDMFMSPFAATHRIQIAVSATVAVLIAHESRRLRAASAPSPQAVSPRPRRAARAVIADGVPAGRGQGRLPARGPRTGRARR